jgi:hypothetical protein
MTIATVCGLVGAVLGARLRGALFELPGVVAMTIFARIGGDFFGYYI